jgi:hypothetical protein
MSEELFEREKDPRWQAKEDAAGDLLDHCKQFAYLYGRDELKRVLDLLPILDEMTRNELRKAIGKTGEGAQ